MSIIVNLYYTGQNGNARKFAEEMTARGIVDAVRAEEGNERYEYFFWCRRISRFADRSIMRMMVIPMTAR